jgi:hypothetical protein
MTPLIQRVLADESFPSHPRVQIGEEKGKPVYQFYIPPEEFYQEGEKVFANFTNSDNKKMRYVFRFGKYNVDKVLERMGKELTYGEFECLIVGTEFR